MAAALSLPTITPRTFAVVKDLMQRDGLDSSDTEQVSLYVERLIARERLFRTVNEVRQRTKDVPAEELQSIIDEAVEDVEAEFREASSDAAPPR
jgi:hypothetical protein